MEGNRDIDKTQKGGPIGIGPLGMGNCQNTHRYSGQVALRSSVMPPPKEIGQTQERTEKTLLDPEEIEALRTRVAENLGWRKLEYSASGLLVGLPPGLKKPSSVPSYGRDVTAAWEIVDFLAQRGIRTQIEIKILGGPVRPCVVEIGDREAPISRATYPSPATALCLAFDLAAKAVLGKPLQ
jgi:hypothetical protein